MLTGRVLDARFGFEGCFQQFLRLRQVGNDRAVRPLRRAVDGVHRNHVEAELGRRFAQQFAARAAVFVAVMHVEQDAVGFRQREILADFGRCLGERAHDLRLDLGDAQQHRSERALDDRADLVCL